jgi:hypothetical protein
VNKLLADLVALLHGLVVAYLAGGTVVIVVGLIAGWGIARNFLFRYSHLLLCLIVNVFEWANVPCPLTTLEWYLRERSSDQSGFIQHYVSQTIHVPIEPSVLARLTIPLLIFTAALYRWAGPRREELAEPAVDSFQPTYSIFYAAPVLCLVTVGVTVCFDGCIALGRLLLPGCDQGMQLNIIFLALAASLCLASPRECGLGIGRLRAWQRHDLKCAAVFALPPLGVVLVYAQYTSKPFNGMPVSYWLMNSIAQDLIFTGFIYSVLSSIWNVRYSDWRDAFTWPMLLTPVFFTLWHWPNSRWLEPSYFAFQCVYVFLGGWWMLHLRRWTGSLWPGAVLHVIINYLAARV